MLFFPTLEVPPEPGLEELLGFDLYLLKPVALLAIGALSIYGIVIVIRAIRSTAKSEEPKTVDPELAKAPPTLSFFRRKKKFLDPNAPLKEFPAVPTNASLSVQKETVVKKAPVVTRKAQQEMTDMIAAIKSIAPLPAPGPLKEFDFIKQMEDEETTQRRRNLSIIDEDDEDTSQS